jgi:hypothetical protein
VKVEFEEDFPHEIASVKFGEVYAPQIEFKRPRTLVITTPNYPHGRADKVKIEIETVYHHSFILDNPFEYK